MLTGKHLIAGEWVSSEKTFISAPAKGESRAYSDGGAAEVDRAVQAAEEAFWSYGYSTRAERAAFLNKIADEIEARADQITEIGSSAAAPPVSFAFSPATSRRATILTAATMPHCRTASRCRVRISA
jgi:2,5-dioxopentanoate dehydrogenase